MAVRSEDIVVDIDDRDRILNRIERSLPKQRRMAKFAGEQDAVERDAERLKQFHHVFEKIVQVVLGVTVLEK